MRKFVYITGYLLTGLYIAWDQTVLLNMKAPSKAPKQYYGWEISEASHYPAYMRSRYPQDLVKDWEAVAGRIALLNNEGQIIPFKDLHAQRFLLITVGESLPVFADNLRHYAEVKEVKWEKAADWVKEEMSSYRPWIVAVNRETLSPENMDLLHKLAAEEGVVFVNFHGLDHWKQIQQPHAWLQVYEADTLSQTISAQMLFGGLGIQARIPVLTGINQFQQVGYTTAPTRLAYVPPAILGISEDSLARIAAIVTEGMSHYAMPGCQILIAKSGQVFYHESFGYHTYNRQRRVRNSDIYDLASITKVAATTLAAMKAYEAGDLDLYQPIHTYFRQKTWPARSVRISDTLSLEAFHQLKARAARAGEGFWQDLDTLSYQDTLMVVSYTRNSGANYVPSVLRLSASDLMSHRSGIQASLPMPSSLRRQSRFASFRPQAEQDWVTLPHAYEDTLWQMTRRLEIRRGGYLYSDVNMMLMQKVLDSITRQPINRYVYEHFYRDLGLRTMSFNPLNIYEKDRIVPTEQIYGTRRFLQGVVHDPIAKLSGGVAGHAGLFSNASDLAIMMQMLLNDGAYGGKRFLDSATVAQFVHAGRGFRGLGFNTALGSGVIAPSAALTSFGHTGFTGTCVWVDPENELVFVFLSNRVHPTSNNRLLAELRIRENVHQVAYNAMGIPHRYIAPYREMPEPVLAVHPSDPEEKPFEKSIEVASGGR